MYPFTKENLCHLYFQAIKMSTIFTAFILFAVFQSVFGQFYGTGGGYAGYGFGCGQQVQHFGSECYQPETGKGTVVCVG